MSMLTVNAIGPNMATVSGPGVPAATYKLDDDGIVRQYQFRRNKECWVAVHSDRIINVVKAALNIKGKYAVKAPNGTTIWEGEAESAEDARKRAIIVERLPT